MNTAVHRIYIGIMAVIIIFTTTMIIYNGFNYYNTSLEERFFQDNHTQLKPSGPIGHGLGIIGTLFMIVGVSTYMIRKRYRRISRLGYLKHWLEFHIFLCTLGPIMVLFHTAFKFGGIVAISFWSMVAVFLSGVIGRFIYIQIPRSIEGRELSLSEVKSMKGNIGDVLKNSINLNVEDFNVILESTLQKVELYSKNIFIRYLRSLKNDRNAIKNVMQVLRRNNASKQDRKKILQLVKNEISLNRRIDRLTAMQNLFKYWHVAHLPFALVMLIIMVIHVAVTIVFGYKWIF
ncbi:MAG: hypothetical protein K9H58_17605 [Bacteroidales bacterium]|nr:hypothetical protein [Bacteroidales bacterium]